MTGTIISVIVSVLRKSINRESPTVQCQLACLGARMPPTIRPGQRHRSHGDSARIHDLSVVPRTQENSHEESETTARECFVATVASSRTAFAPNVIELAQSAPEPRGVDSIQEEQTLVRAMIRLRSTRLSIRGGM